MKSEIPVRTWRWLGVNDIDNLPDECREIHVKPGENISVVDTKPGRMKVTVEDNANFSYTGILIDEKNIATELIIELVGKKSSADVASIYFGMENQKIDMNYIIKHFGRKSQSNIEVRGALKNSSEKIFRGTIDFQRGSKGAVGRENEVVTILSDDVKNKSVPILLAQEDDVDGQHAVSSGKIDPEKFFYLLSRGLDEVEAQKLIVQAAFNPILDRIDDENLRAEIFSKIEKELDE